MREEKMIDSKLLDTSIWLAYLLEGTHKNLIESKENIFISPISIFETKKKLLDKNIPKDEIENKIEFIKKRAVSINLTNTIAEKASELSYKNKLPAIDSLIYSTSLANNSILITLDNDFRSLENVQILN